MNDWNLEFFIAFLIYKKIDLKPNNYIHPKFEILSLFVPK